MLLDECFRPRPIPCFQCFSDPSVLFYRSAHVAEAIQDKMPKA